jgi:hypothetical protein
MGAVSVSFLGRWSAAAVVTIPLAITSVLGFAPVVGAHGAGTDEAVDDAIRQAVRWIKEQRKPEGHWELNNTGTDDRWAGTTALALLALLYAGEDPRADLMSDSLTWLAAQKLTGTYVVGTRAHVLALVPGRKYTTELKGDLKWLLDAVYQRGSENPGCYTYQSPGKDAKSGNWDNSNSQFGVLGVWMAAEAGLEVPAWYWEIVAEHWITCQTKEGGWGYLRDQPPTGSMTAAGLTALFVALDQRYAGRPQEAGGLISAIDAGLTWLARNYSAENPGGESQWRYYYLYGVERAGRASGRKHFREKDWFREGAAYLLENQRPDGAWPGSGTMTDQWNTCFGLMFLCHGRAPLLFNKLEHGSDWNSKLRDVAGLTRYVGHTLERLLNWQIVRLDAPLEDLLEAPVLYLRGEAAWTFEDTDVQAVREYCLAGGLFFAVAGGEGFRQSVESLARRAFPDFPLHPLPDDHPLFNGDVSFPIDKPPRVLEVNNGLRTLLLLCTHDLAPAWNRYAVKGTSEQDFQLAANVYLYATDKTQVRSRLQTPCLPLRQTKTERKIEVARLKYGGTWDVEPFGWTRLVRYMNNEAATQLLVTSGVALDSDALQDFHVAYITGTGAFELTGDELKGLRRFFSAGGTLLADAAGGSRDFTKSLEDYLRDVLQEEPRLLPAESLIYTGRGISGTVDLSGVMYRRAALGMGKGRKYPLLKAFGERGRFLALYSPLDLSTGLLGTPVYNVQGYEPASALKVMRNLLLYADLSRTEKARLYRGETE